MARCRQRTHRRARPHEEPGTSTMVRGASGTTSQPQHPPPGAGGSSGTAESAGRTTAEGRLWAALHVLVVLRLARNQPHPLMRQWSGWRWTRTTLRWRATTPCTSSGTPACTRPSATAAGRACASLRRPVGLTVLSSDAWGCTPWAGRHIVTGRAASGRGRLNLMCAEKPPPSCCHELAWVFVRPSCGIAVTPLSLVAGRRRFCVGR